MIMHICIDSIYISIRVTNLPADVHLKFNDSGDENQRRSRITRVSIYLPTSACKSLGNEHGQQVTLKQGGFKDITSPKKTGNANLY